LIYLETKEFWFFEPQPMRNGEKVAFNAWKADPEKDTIFFYKL